MSRTESKAVRGTVAYCTTTMSNVTADVHRADCINEDSSTIVAQSITQQVSESKQNVNGDPRGMQQPRYHTASARRQHSSFKQRQQQIAHLLNDPSHQDDLDIINAADLNITEAIQDRKQYKELKEFRDTSRIKVHREPWRKGHKKMSVTGIEEMRILRAQIQAVRGGIAKERKAAFPASNVHVPIMTSIEGNEAVDTPAMGRSVYYAKVAPVLTAHQFKDTY
jgi:hypothetical protein